MLMDMTPPRCTNLPGYGRHLPTQLFQLCSAVVMGLIGGENRRHHHLLVSRVLPMMFECMFDRLSQHPPTDTVKKRERLFHTAGTHVASDAFRLTFLLDRLFGRPAVTRISRRAAAG